MRGSIRIALATVILGGFCIGRSHGEFRTWRAAVGNYSTVAEFVSLKPGDVVQLRLQDGSLRELPIGKLSEADRSYVRSLPAAGGARPAAAKAPARPAAEMQTEEAANRSLKSVDREAQHCRTADEAVVLYTVFLSDNTVPQATRSAAEQNMAEWKQMAEKGLVRSATKWVTPAEVRDGRIKSALLINQGLEMVRLSQDQFGLSKLLEASTVAPDDIHADFIIATVYAIALQKFDKAQKHYEVCLRRDPDNPSVLNNLALTEIKVGRPREALQHWKAAAAICQDKRIAQNLGRLFDQAGKRKIIVPKGVLSQLSDVYTNLVVTQNVAVADAKLGWQYMMIPQEPPPDESAEVIPVNSSADSTVAVCGTGFVISDKYVLTTRSSTKGAADFMIADPREKGKNLVARLVASSKDSDLALLQCPELNSPALPTDAALPQPGSDILVAGYPLADASGLALKMVRGNTMDGVTLGDSRVGVLTYEAASTPSVGGGPVTDSMGNVVAMHWKGLESLNYRKGAGIPMSVALAFARKSVPGFRAQRPGQADLPWPEIEKQTQASTVVVLSKTPAQDVGLSKRVGEDFKVDYSCCRCNGFKAVRCLARSCINGKIAHVRQQITGRNTVNGAVLTEDVKFYTPCPVCQGRAVIPCPICAGSGIDPDLRDQAAGSRGFQKPRAVPLMGRPAGF
jgi:S1-C subfamily serine protease/uncharacterized protein (UPF0147 family)